MGTLKAAAWPKFFEQTRLNREKCTHASIGIRSLVFALLNSFLVVPRAWTSMVMGMVIPQSARQPRRQLHQPARVAGNVPRRSRSPQRHRGTEAVQQPVSSTIAVMIDAELSRYLVPAVALDVSNKIKGLQRRNAKWEKLQKDITELREGHLPPGYRVLPHAFETHCLDDLVLQDGIYRQVDASISVREARKRFHLEHLQLQCELGSNFWSNTEHN